MEFLIAVSLNMRMTFEHVRLFIIMHVVFSSSYSQYTDVINSNRPSLSMGAFSVGSNVYQIEQNFSFRNGGFDNFQNASFNGIGSQIQLRIGMFKEQFEIIGELDYQNDILKYENSLGKQIVERNGLKSIGAGFKYLIYDPFRVVGKYKPNLYSWHANNSIIWRDLIPAISIYAGAQFGVGNQYPYKENFYPLFRNNYKRIKEPFVSGTAMLIFQQHLKPGLVVIHNVGAKYIGSEIQEKNLISTLTYSTRSKWSIYLEYIFIDSQIHRDLIFGSGIAYLYKNNLQMDIAFQKNFKTTPSLMMAGIGLSYRIDRHIKKNDQPQDLKELSRMKNDRKKLFKDQKLSLKGERRTAKGLRKLDKKQKRIERKLRKLRKLK
jgi:hypothetical protein